MTLGTCSRGELERQGTLLDRERRSVIDLLGREDRIARGRVVEAEWGIELLAKNDRQGLHLRETAHRREAAGLGVIVDTMEC